MAFHNDRHYKKFVSFSGAVVRALCSRLPGCGFKSGRCLCL